MEDFLLDNPTHTSRPKIESTVRAQVPWHGHRHDVTGVLKPGFLLVGRRVLVPLGNVHPPLPGDGGTDVWVDVDRVQPISPIESESLSNPTGTSFILRSTMHELPGDQRRDYALRTLSVTLSQFVAAGGTHVALAPGVENMMELTVIIDVFDVPADGNASGRIDTRPSASVQGPDAGIHYLWKFRQATRPGTDRPALWVPPPPPFAAADLIPDGRAGTDGPIGRAQAAHHIGQLPLWLTTRRFWTVFRWHGGRLQHVLQFSVPNKFRRILVGRFRLQP